MFNMYTFFVLPIYLQQAVCQQNMNLQLIVLSLSSRQDIQLI